MVLVTTPPHPASKARRMLLSDSVGGAEDSRNGLLNLIPVNVTDRSRLMRPSAPEGVQDSPLARFRQRRGGRAGTEGNT